MRQILSITHYEFLHILKDKILFLLVFFAPLGYAAVFGFVYVSGLLTNIPFAIVDLDHSKLSREVATAFENSSRFKVVQEIKTYPHLEEGMKTGAVRAGIVIPEDFEKMVSQHRSTAVLTVYDASNLIWGYNIRKCALEVINKFNMDHTASYLAGLGLTRQEITNTMDTVSCNIDIWYNPTFNYANYLFMGLVMMIIHQICLLSVSITVTREKERNSWFQYICCPVPRWKVFLGKCLPYFVSTFFNYGLLIWISARFVHVKIEGSMALIILLGLLYSIIMTSGGFYISTLAPNSLQATRFLMLLSVPFFMISGFTWPETHIPAFINGLAHLLPFTWMAEGFRLVTVKNLGVQYISNTILALTLMAALSLLLAMNFAKQRKPPAAGGLTVNSEEFYPRKN